LGDQDGGEEFPGELVEAYGEPAEVFELAVNGRARMLMALPLASRTVENYESQERDLKKESFYAWV
jgi:hypothetical protein